MTAQDHMLNKDMNNISEHQQEQNMENANRVSADFFDFIKIKVASLS